MIQYIVTHSLILFQTLSHEPKVLQEGLLQLDSILSSLEPLHRPIESPGGSVLLRELACAGNVADATLSAQATPLLHALTAAHAYIMMFVHTCRVGQVRIILYDFNLKSMKCQGPTYNCQITFLRKKSTWSSSWKNNLDLALRFGVKGEEYLCVMRAHALNCYVVSLS